MEKVRRTGMNSEKQQFPEFMLIFVTRNNESCSELRSLFNEAIRNLINEEKDPVRLALWKNLQKRKDIPVIQTKEQVNSEENVVLNIHNMFHKRVIHDDQGKPHRCYTITIYDEGIQSYFDQNEILTIGVDRAGFEEKSVEDIMYGLRKIHLDDILEETRKFA